MSEFIAHISEDGRIQTVREHCENTARIASQNLKTAGLRNTGYLSGLLHDMGKDHEDFTEYIRQERESQHTRVIHTFAAVKFIIERYHFGSAVDHPFANCTAEIIAIAAGSHHGLLNIYDERGISEFKHRLNRQPERDDEAIKNFLSDFPVSEIDDLFRASCDEIEYKLMNEISPISKDNTEILFYSGMLQRLITSAVIDADRKDTSEFMTGEEKHVRIGWETPLRNLENYLRTKQSNEEISEARTAMTKLCLEFAGNKPDVYQVNIPTGGAKTLSTLGFAFRHAGLYQKRRVICPTPLLTILEQNAKEIRNAVNNDAIITEHHSNVIQEKGKTQRELMSVTWDSQVVMTTMTQFLNTLFDGKTSSVRRLQSLCDSVIILDEVQSVPINQISIFNMAINFLCACCRTTILLCSATQPVFDQTKHPMIISDKKVIPEDIYEKIKPVFKRTKARYYGECDLYEIADIAKGYIEKHNNLLAVCNTKKEALDLYRELSEEVECYYLSTYMCPEHRSDVIDTVKAKAKRNEKFACVSTQLIEAGVDISLGSGIRYAAGADNAEQTGGRVNRNKEYGIAPLGIVALKGEQLNEGLKDIRMRKDAFMAFTKIFDNDPEKFDNDLLSERSIKRYYEMLFQSIESVRGAMDFPTGGHTILDLLSDNAKYTANAKTQIARQAYKKAGQLYHVFDNDQISVLVPYKNGKKIISRLLACDPHDVKEIKQIVREANRSAVNVFDNQFEILLRNGAIHAGPDELFYYLDENYYDNTGIIFTEKEDNSCNTLTR